MHRFTVALLVVFLIGVSASPLLAEGKKGKLPHVEFDVENKTVRVECEALNVDAPLEFFCCITGSNEHESVLRTSAKPSDIQIGLLALGLKPGQPLTYSEATNKWIQPHGPPLHITVEYEKDGKPVTCPAYRWIRNVKTKKSPPAFTWVYAGSRVMEDGKFAADVTGYVVSICNFDLTLIDVPELVSSANETLEWERNAELMPKTGTKVWMIIEPVGKDAKEAPASAPAAESPKTQSTYTPDETKLAFSHLHGKTVDCEPAAAPPTPLSDVHIDKEKVDKLENYWKSKVSPHSAALREAAEAHYKVISDLRREQQRLIDEADRVQRTIDKLEKDYQDMTTPRPQAAPQE